MRDWLKFTKDNCFIIAEAGVAHFGSLEKAKKLANLAYNAGADAVKFQIFNTEKLFAKEENEWKERLKSRCLSPQNYSDVKKYCEDLGILFFATAHDEESLDYLLEIGVDLLKVGSGEVGNIPFLGKVIESGIPSIISTGMYEEKQIIDLIELIGDDYLNVALLHCVTEYPVPFQRANFARFLSIKEMYPGAVGFSDHSEGSLVPVVACTLGARIIEKHISLDFNVPNAQDWKVSLDENGFKEMVSRIRVLEKEQKLFNVKGESNKRDIFKISSYEKKSLYWASKSAVYKRSMDTGECLNWENIEFRRPGSGLSFSAVKKFIGKTLKENVEEGSLILEGQIEK